MEFFLEEFFDEDFCDAFELPIVSYSFPDVSYTEIITSMLSIHSKRKCS